MPDIENLRIGENVYSISDANARLTKQDKLVSGTNIKTIGGASLLGAGDVYFELSQPTSAAWTVTSSIWSPSKDGIATVYMNPSNSSSAYVRIVDQNRNNYLVCQLSTTSGLATTGCFPVNAGHQYAVSTQSSNISAFQVTLYTFEFN